MPRRLSSVGRGKYRQVAESSPEPKKTVSLDNQKKEGRIKKDAEPRGNASADRRFRDLKDLRAEEEDFTGETHLNSRVEKDRRRTALNKRAKNKFKINKQKKRKRVQPREGKIEKFS